jgi:hypothetical protein
LYDKSSAKNVSVSSSDESTSEEIEIANLNKVSTRNLSATLASLGSSKNDAYVAADVDDVSDEEVPKSLEFFFVADDVAK